MPLDKRYDPACELAIQQFWDDNNIYSFDEKSEKPSFTIDTPPPTLSGKMHLGHACSYSHGDFIARFFRMRGFNVIYPWGTDDNGLPTERLVEKKLGVNSLKLSRAEFVRMVLDFIKKESSAFTASWKRIGVSADFKNAYSTIDPHCQKVSQLSFLDLYNKGLVFRKKTPVSWCVKCQTAIAQAEFDNITKESLFSDIAFIGPDLGSSSDGRDSVSCDSVSRNPASRKLIISTTRPELIPACVALAAHPDDDRYKPYFGKKATVPLFNYEVPIIADIDADMELGSGLMMVCTFGDKEDVTKWYRHNLDLRSLFTPDGRLTSIAPGFEGLRITEAREAILKALKDEGFLLSQKKISHSTNVHERCSTPIEFLNTDQWFINVMSFKKELLELGNKISWHPLFMHARYNHWVENLNWDWCISRQRHFGVPFPVWYHKSSGEIIVPEADELPVDPMTCVPRAFAGREDELIPETDVIDTWATSSMTPQIVLRWGFDNDFFKNNFPMSIRLQAHDIIRTWAFYTMVKSLHHHNMPPWDNIVISGHTLDSKGRKMSKSKGNVVDPMDVVNKYSADALRYWAASTKLGEDLIFMEKDILTGQKTVNKLWNASRFSISHLADYTGEVPQDTELIDRWILARFADVVDKCTSSFESFEYSKAKMAVDNFFWNVFCDYYLELVKDRLYNADTRGPDKRLSAQYTLYTVLLGLLKLLAPIIPHVTDVIYRSFFAAKEDKISIHVSDWPVVFDNWRDQKSLDAGELIIDMLSAVRKYKSANKLSLGASIPFVRISAPFSARRAFEDAMLDFKATARVDSVKLEEGELGIYFE